MRLVLITTAVCLANISCASAAGTFSFEMPEQKLRIVVPDIPQMKMEIHPNAATQPHARFMGSDMDSGNLGFSISVLTPTADAGMSPRDCARSLGGNIIKRFRVDSKFVVTQQTNESTVVMLFPLKTGPLVQFKAFLLSGYAGTNCIEVHVSRTVVPPTPEYVSAQLPSWFQGFRSAKIEIDKN